MKTYIAYYRVSTVRQGKSGLGLEAQKSAVTSYLKDSEPLAEYTDIESGKKNDRPNLKAAIDHCKEAKATLLIAKLDRLSRNAQFIFLLKDSGVDFVCCDMPVANTLTIGIFAVLAQHEREMISTRVKAALAAKKARGFKLGSPQNNLTDEHRQKSKKVIQGKAAANENNRRAMSMIAAYLDNNLSYSEIARKLNTTGFKTSKGRAFTAVQVRRLAQKIKNQNDTEK